MTVARLRAGLVALWVMAVTAGLYTFIFHRTWIETSLSDAASTSAIVVATVYLIFGCLRGFTLIPSTSLVLAAVPFVPPGRLFVLTLAGIVVSAASLYWFAGALQIDAILRRRHAARIDAVERLLRRHGFPVIVGWSFFPLVPTDLICWVCGALRTGAATCLAGVAIGEGGICAVYIVLGHSLLRSLGLG